MSMARSFSDMNNLMGFQIAFLIKSSATKSADERTFSCVYTHVNLQVGFSHKSISAQTANKVSSLLQQSCKAGASVT